MLLPSIRRMLSAVILLLLVSFDVKTPSKIESTTAIKQMIDSADHIAETNTAIAFQLFERAQQMARNAGEKELLAQALYAETYYFFFDGKYVNILPKIREAATIYNTLDMTVDECKCYNREGVALMNLNKYAQSLTALFKAKALAEQTEDKKLQPAIHTNIGLVYESLNDWDNAMIYARKSMSGKRDSGDTLGIVRSYSNIANIYYYQKKYDSSLAYFRQAKKYSRSIDNPYQEATINSDLGNLLADMDQLDSAIYYQYEALKFHALRREERLTEWCHTITSLGNTWLKKGNLKKAAIFLRDCKTCETTMPDLSFLKSFYTFRSAFYAKVNQPEQAMHNLQRLNQVNDSILQKAGNLENQRIAIRYEFTQKAREDSLRYQLSIFKQQTATASYRSKMYLLMVGLLAVVGLAIIIVMRIRKLQEARRKREIEAMRNDIASDLHDDIGSTLSSIQIISNLAMTQCKENLQLKQSVSRIFELSGKVSDGIREIVWSVNPEHDKLEAVITQLRKLAADVLGANDIPFKFTEQVENCEAELTPEQQKDLMMIFKEAINNARKYSGAERVEIHIRQAGQTLSIQIKDNGCGFEKDELAPGNGLKNMQRRSAAINGQFSIHSTPGKGTVLSLQIPLS